MNLTESKTGGSTGGSGLDQSRLHLVKSEKDTTLENSNKQNSEQEVSSETLTCEENEEVKFHNWAKIRGLGLTKIRLGIAGISSVAMLRDQAHEVFDNYQIVADMYKPDITSERLLVPSKVSESTDEFQGVVVNATDELQLFNIKHIKLKKSAKLPGPSPLVKPSDFSLVAPPLVSAPAALKKTKSLQGQKPEEAKKKEDIVPRKLGEMVNREGNKKLLPEHRAKLLRKKCDRKQDKNALGNALNLSTSISSDKFFFGFTPAALPATGGFSFGELNNTPSVSNPMTKSNSNGAFQCSPFRFSAAVEALFVSSGGLGSSVLKPAQQQPRSSLHNEVEELLFVIRANLYRLTDGDWMMCGPGHVKIWRHIETKTLRVAMRQEKVLKVCLNHLLTTDVVYRSMDRKSWIFAAYDFSKEKRVLERFTLRFKNNIAAQEFISAVRSALNGTAEAIKSETDKGTNGNHI